MINKRVYRTMAERLEKNGLFTVMMRPDQLVFSPPSHMRGAWLTYYQEQWYLGTWHPCVYRIKSARNIVQICKAYLLQKKSAATPDLIEKFQLVELSDAEMESMFDHQEARRS